MEVGFGIPRPPFNDCQAERRARATDLEWHVATAHTEKMLEKVRHSAPNIDSIPKHHAGDLRARHPPMRSDADDRVGERIFSGVARRADT